MFVVYETHGGTEMERDKMFCFVRYVKDFDCILTWLQILNKTEGRFEERTISGHGYYLSEDIMLLCPIINVHNLMYIINVQNLMYIIPSDIQL